MLAGAQDTKFAGIGRQMVTVARGDSPPAVSIGAEDSASSGGAIQELSAALPSVTINSSSAAGGEATSAASVRSAAAVSGRLINKTDSRVEHGSCNRAQFAEVPGAGHAVHVERPEAVARLLGAWLAGDAS